MLGAKTTYAATYTLKANKKKRVFFKRVEDLEPNPHSMRVKGKYYKITTQICMFFGMLQHI
jgi:GH25 family lysozyme M1 (1,4-beta-N-acetylmuramidase)